MKTNIHNLSAKKIAKFHVAGVLVLIFVIQYWCPQLGRNSTKTFEADGCFMVKDMSWVTRRTIYCLAKYYMR